MLGLLAEAQGRHERAARLCAASLALWDALDSQTLMQARVEADPELTAAYARLDRSELHDAWAEARALTLEQAIDYAFEATGSQ